MTKPAGNLFANLPHPSPDEETTALLSADTIKIERIVSTGQASLPDFWYDQAWAEWVMVVAGSARVLFAGEAESHAMKAGDYLLIPAHCRHRVEWTDPDVPTVWLAVHFNQ